MSSLILHTIFQGGAGKCAKCIVSAGAKSLNIIVHLPEEIAAEYKEAKGDRAAISLQEWANVFTHKDIQAKIVSEEKNVIRVSFLM